MAVQKYSGMRPGAPYSGTRNYSGPMQVADGSDSQQNRSARPASGGSDSSINSIRKESINSANQAADVLKKTTPLGGTVDGLRGGTMSRREREQGL